jgi:hypothetical protein
MLIAKGDLVRHPIKPSWGGIGKVVKTVQGGNLLVRFDQAGNKLLHPEYAGLVKIQDDELLFLVVRGTRTKKGRTMKTLRIIPVIMRQT